MATWTTSLKLPRDPVAEDDYLFEWGAWLDGSDIASISVTATDVTIDSSSVVNSDQDVTVRISGGTNATVGTVTCKVTTDDSPARVDSRSVDFYTATL